MFHKEKSSLLLPNGKKAKDTPVRKSDRKGLLTTVLEVLSNKNNNDTEKQQRLLEHVFLKGNLWRRTLQTPSGQVVEAYFRSASTEDEKQYWPYTLHPQCVWLNYQEGTVHLPGLALLSVLTHAEMDPTNTTTTTTTTTTTLTTVFVHSPTSKFICRGAHVMRAGIVETVPRQALHGGAVVKVLGNDQPFCVGIYQSGEGEGGVGVSVLHAYGDDLWRQQQSSADADKNLFDRGHYGNPGFVDGKHVVPVKVVEEESGDHQGNNDDTESEVDPETKLSPEQVLHAAVCKALLGAKKDLPMLMATFYANHVLPSRPAGTMIELKTTKYKKFGNYVKEKVEEEFLMVGPDQNQNAMAMLVDFDHRHPDLDPYKTQKNQDAPKSGKKGLVLMDLYCIPNHWTKLLRLNPDSVKAGNATSPERRNSSLLTVKEVHQILDEYVQREDLTKRNDPSIVVLDGPLTDVLYKKKGGAAPTELSRKRLKKVWQGCMEAGYAMVEVPANKVVKLKRGAHPVIVIEVSRRQNKKFQTTLSGLEAFGVDLKTFAKELQHRFASSATINEKELLCQGNLGEEMEAFLLGDEALTSHGGARNSPYRLPKNAVQVVLRKGVPARKKKR